MKENYEFYHKNGEYSVKLKGTDSKVLLTKEIFYLLRRDQERVLKMRQRNARRLVSTDHLMACTEGGDRIGYAEKKHLLALNVQSAEDTFLSRDFSNELASTLKNCCSAEELTILQLSFGENLSDRECADFLGIPRSTFNYRRRKLYQRLRKELKDFVK